jgi:hypothetical protein
MRLELNIDFCNGFFYTLTAEKSLNSACRRNGRFSCMRSKRKSMLHKAPADFSTASGENSGADGANSRQNQGVSVVPTGAPVSLLSSHTPLPESLGLGHCRQTMDTPPEALPLEEMVRLYQNQYVMV